MECGSVKRVVDSRDPRWIPALHVPWSPYPQQFYPPHFSPRNDEQHSILRSLVECVTFSCEMLEALNSLDVKKASDNKHKKIYVVKREILYVFESNKRLSFSSKWLYEFYVDQKTERKVVVFL